MYRQSWYEDGKLQYYYLGQPSSGLYWRVMINNKRCEKLGIVTQYPYADPQFVKGFELTSKTVTGTRTYTRDREWFWVTDNCLPLGFFVIGWGGPTYFFNVQSTAVEDLSIPEYCSR